MRLGVVKVEHLALGSAAIGSAVGRLRRGYCEHPRWKRQLPLDESTETQQKTAKVG